MGALRFELAYLAVMLPLVAVVVAYFAGVGA